MSNYKTNDILCHFRCLSKHYERSKNSGKVLVSLQSNGWAACFRTLNVIFVPRAQAPSFRHGCAFAAPWLHLGCAAKPL